MNLHVIIGEDDFLVDAAAKKFVGDGTGLEVIDSRESTNAELQLRDLRLADESFSTPPMFDPRKVTWWKNVHFLPGGGGKKAAAEEVKAALEKFADRLAALPLPENQQFILSGPHLLKTSTLARRLAGVAEMLVFAAEKPWEAARNAAVRVIDAAQEMGLKFEREQAEKFVARVGLDARSQLNELAKLRDYLGAESTVITAAAIDAVTSPGVGVEPEIWAITDALGKRDLRALMGAVEKFESENGFAVLVTTVVERFFRQLVELKAAGGAPGSNSWAVRKQQEFLRYWSLGELRSARARFMRLRERAVSSAGAVDDLIVATLVRVCRRARR